MRRTAAAVLLGALVLTGCASSGRKPLPGVARARAEIAAARASDSELFAIFPRLPGVRRCSIPVIEGLRESTLAGTCRTRLRYPRTHGHGEMRIVFRESWGRGRFSSWTLWEGPSARKVLVTKLHGEPAPQLRYAATDGVAGDVRLTRNVPCAGGRERLVGPKTLRRFHAVTAVSCIDGTRTYPDQGQWSVRIRRVAVGGVAGLQRYFEQPDQPRLPKGGECLLVARFVLVPTFVAADGHWIVPRTPVDACGPLPGDGRAAQHVHWRVVSVRRVRLMVSAAALAAHCAMQIKDLPAGAIGRLDPTQGGPLFESAPKAARVCVYRTSDFEVGSFVRGFSLAARETHRLLGALTGAAPTGSCPDERTFAVVSASGGRWMEVELGGCFRVGRTYPGYGLGGADPAVVRALLGSR